MPREISSELEPLLALYKPYTQSTLTLYPVGGDPIYLATDRFTFGGNVFKSDLVRIDEIRQSLGVPTDLLTGEAQQVTKAFGKRVMAEELVKATGVVGRLYRNPDNPEQQTWEELFRGEFIPREINQEGAAFEILHDLVAAGFCVANWTLAENCQFVFKHAGTCGYIGDLAACNKKRQSLGGCQGRENEYRFGGMEYPDVQVPSPPITGGGGGGGGDGDPGFPPASCPTLDQYVLVRGRGYRPVPKQVAELVDTDELYHPIWKTFHEIDALRIVRDQPLWNLETENGGKGFSSHTHPVLWYREHANGSPVSRSIEGDPVLTWSNELADTKATHSQDLDERGDVMAISLVDGKIYCYSNTPDGPFIVCHNKPAWEGGYVN